MILARLLLELALIPGVAMASYNQVRPYPALATFATCVFLFVCALSDAAMIGKVLP